MTEQAEQPQRRHRRPNLTDKQIAALPRKRQRYVQADPEQRSLYLRVPPEGPITFAVAERDPYGRKRWVKIGTTADMKIDEARERARTAIRRIKDGLPAFEPVAEAPDTYKAVAEQWLESHAKKEGLRTFDEIKRLLDKHVLPVWGKRDFADIRRRNINDLLDAIAAESGPWTADHVLPIIRKIANWYATRDDDYTSPFVPGMRRTRTEARERDHILSDKELKKVWKQAKANGIFGALVRLLLLTAQRRDKIVTMKWTDLKGDVWEIETAPREKGNAGALRLPAEALAIIKAQPKIRGNAYVFAASRGDGPLNGFNKRKATFDEACGVTGWTLHDLRRTARSLMSRDGVSNEHAERALGHKMGGVRGIYDRYEYFEEKSAALAKVAALIDSIVNPYDEDAEAVQAAQ